MRIATPWFVSLAVLHGPSATKAEEVSVCRDATYDIPASRGSVCVGNGMLPRGWACPLKGDVPSKDCRGVLPSFSGGNCVAKESAKCARLSSGTWGCVFPTTGCDGIKPASQDVTCPSWAWNDSSEEGYYNDPTTVINSLGGSTDIEKTLDITVSESWFVEDGPVSDLYACNQKPTPPPTTPKPPVTTTPPPTTPRPTPPPTSLAPTTPKPTTPAPTTPTPTTPEPTTPAPTTPAPTTPTPTTPTPTTPTPTTPAPTTPAPTTPKPTTPTPTTPCPTTPAPTTPCPTTTAPPTPCPTTTAPPTPCPTTPEPTTTAPPTPCPTTTAPPTPCPSTTAPIPSPATPSPTSVEQVIP